jgi:hypothetical protein
LSAKAESEGRRTLKRQQHIDQIARSGFFHDMAGSTQGAAQNSLLEFELFSASSLVRNIMRSTSVQGAKIFFKYF